MKSSWKIIIFIIILFIALFAIESQMPKKFVWRATFSQHDKQPFGCYVFDDVLKSSLPNGYSVTDKTFYQIHENSMQGRKSYLCINGELYFNLRLEQNIEIRQLLEDGNKIMIVTQDLEPFGDADKTVDFNYVWDSSLADMSKDLSKNKYERESITLANGKKYAFYSQLFSAYLSTKYREEGDTLNINFKAAKNNPNKSFNFVDSLSFTVLAQNEQNNPVAIKINVGKGELYVVSTPILFTNYGILDGDNAGYIFDLLSYISDLPVVRTEGYVNKSYTSAESQSPLRYILSILALRWALYLSLILLLLFMLFTARRRQRVIPVINKPTNRALEFIKLIGTLYYQRKDYTDLTRKKIIYFCEQIKLETHIDIKAEELTPELCERLSGKTGADAQKFYQLLVELQGIQNKEDIKLTEEQMMQYIDRMNEILKTI